MGATYSSCVVLGSALEDVIRALSDRTAYVGETENDVVVVFDHDDDHDVGDGTLAGHVSSELDCRVLEVAIFDDDFAVFAVVRDGEIMAELSVGDDEVTSPDVNAFVEALERGRLDDVHAALSGGWHDASELHASVLTALGLPNDIAGWGFRYLERDAEGAYTGPPLRRVGG